MQTSVKLHNATVVSNKPCAQGLWHMVFKAPDLAATIKPGQFFNLKVPRDEQDLLRIPLSFSAASADNETVEVVYAAVGSASRSLTKASAGQQFDVLGPSGRPWPLPKQPGRCLLVSGGVGITPLVALADLLSSHQIAFDAVVGAQTSAKLWGQQELLARGAHKVVVSTDDGSEGIHGYALAAVEQLVNECDRENPYTQVYTCGPHLMMGSLAKYCEDHNMACYASLERLMACSFGVCGTCVVGLKKGGYGSCCMNGPIFDASEVIW